VQIKDGPGTDKDALVWKWVAGEATPKADFGAPLATTAYALCIYAGDDLVTAATIPAGGLCDGKPCWKEQATGFSFRARATAPRSSLAVKLREGLAPGSAKIFVKASGTAVPPPDLAALDAPLAVQLLAGSGACWEAVYSPPFLSRSAVQLRDRAD
jgi:hypothetical protein